MPYQEYYEENRDYLREQKKEYYQKHRQEIIDKALKWRQDNPEKYKAQRQAQMERERIRGWTMHYKDRILALNNDMCAICKGKENLELHHIEYVRDLNAVMVLCHRCHGELHYNKREYKKKVGGNTKLVGISR